MSTDDRRPAWGASQQLTARVLGTIERFLHVEAVSGGVLIAAGIVALLWANSPLGHSYHALWDAPIAFGIGEFSVTLSLHFLVNEGLMTIFFLLAGLEIRRELHEGALSTLRAAALPIAGAVGGMLVPAALYLVFSPEAELRQGWAVPVATDIAFALGVLALLGRSIPSAVRVLLLALAIIDDIGAVAIIALFYSGDLDPSGTLFAGAAVAVVLILQRLGIRSAIPYILPGLLLWYGLWRLGVHPTLAGVVLGVLTPVVPLGDPKRTTLAIERLRDVGGSADQVEGHELARSLRGIHRAERDLVPPVVSVETALHPWVAYAILPLFALANAGVTFSGASFGADHLRSIAYGVLAGLLVGKPLGILGASAIAIRMRWCDLPGDIGWRGLTVVALLGGVGFTMAVFIANLAFDSSEQLASAKLAVLIASAASAVIALAFGKSAFRKRAEPFDSVGAPVEPQGD
jgi:NhaA family Na+:H+ antiporter